MTHETLRDPLPEIHLTPLASPVATYLVRDTQDADPWDLSAPYQRGTVWTDEQRRALVKSLLMRLPVGAVTYAKLPYDRARFNRVIDGKQRIEAVRAFREGRLDVPGYWWQEDDLHDPDARARDVTYAHLSARGRGRFDLAPLPGLEFYSATRAVRVQGWREPSRRGDERTWCWKWEHVTRTEAEMLAAEAEVYLLLNGGGTAQTAETMANAAAHAGTELRGAS